MTPVCGLTIASLLLEYAMDAPNSDAGKLTVVAAMYSLAKLSFRVVSTTFTIP